MNINQLDVLKLGKQLQFHLTISAEDEELPRKQFRLERKFFAIACQTNTTIGDYIELREFQPITARHGTKRSPIVQQTNKNINTSNCAHAPTVQNPQLSKHIAKNIMSQVNILFKTTIHIAHQRTALLNKLKYLQSLANNDITN